MRFHTSSFVLTIGEECDATAAHSALAVRKLITH